MNLKVFFVIGLISSAVYMTKADNVEIADLNKNVHTDLNPEMNTDLNAHSPNECWFDEEQIAYLPGTSWVSKGGGKCARYTCKEGGAIGAVGCATFVPLPGYQLTDDDFSKPYPDCCPQPIRRRRKQIKL